LPRDHSSPNASWVIGSADDCDLIARDATVSGHHCRLACRGNVFTVVDLGSSNGTFVDGVRIPPGVQARVTRRAQVMLGTRVEMPWPKLEDNKRGATVLAESSSTTRAQKTIVNFPRDKNEIEVGRDPSCDVPLEFPTISWRHARFCRVKEGLLVKDLNSRNGTYVDGIRIGGKVLVRPGQEIGLGGFSFELLADGELIEREYYGNVTIEAKDIVVCARDGRRLLDPVSLTIFPSELVAVMGPAGAGKTTLLKALNGYTPPANGTVLFNGIDLYRYYNRFRQQMGYVPQDDIVHPQLTIEQALYFSARLRTDLSDAEIAARTEKVLRDLRIFEHAKKQIGSPERKILSGGQRKRVNIALELITDTPVLFLDEPTSGLSSYDAESVVDLLKGLSKAGKTVITTIHQPSLTIYKQFDDLIMVSRDEGKKDEHKVGAMVYFGPAYPDSIKFFRPISAVESSSHESADTLTPEMLEPGMNCVPSQIRTATWRERFLASHYHTEFVANRSGKKPKDGGKTGEERPRRRFGLAQWRALVKRNAIVKLRDRAQAAILLFQAPFFGALLCVVVGPLVRPNDMSTFSNLAKKLVISEFLLAVAAIWFGCNNAVRDIVGEWTIYKRERMVTLKLLPYVFSKLAVLLVLCIFQCGSALGIVYLVCGLHGDFLRQFMSLLIASMIGAALGLCISALSRTNESAIAWLPVVLLPIIALAGGMRPIHELSAFGQSVSVFIPSRWVFEANLLQEAKAKQWQLSAPSQPADHDPPRDLRKDGDPRGVAADVSKNRSTDVAESSFPIEFRHRYRFLVSILGFMVAFLVTVVIVALRRRDDEPQ
jgi:ABC transport system ATP-binding/permease protein